MCLPGSWRFALRGNWRPWGSSGGWRFACWRSRLSCARVARLLASLAGESLSVPGKAKGDAPAPGPGSNTDVPKSSNPELAFRSGCRGDRRAPVTEAQLEARAKTVRPPRVSSPKTRWNVVDRRVKLTEIPGVVNFEMVSSPRAPEARSCLGAVLLLLRHVSDVGSTPPRTRSQASSCQSQRSSGDTRRLRGHLVPAYSCEVSRIIEHAESSEDAPPFLR